MYFHAVTIIFCAALSLICSWEQIDLASLSCWEAAAWSLPRVHDPVTQRFDRDSSAPWRHRFEKINTLTSHTLLHGGKRNEEIVRLERYSTLIHKRAWFPELTVFGVEYFSYKIFAFFYFEFHLFKQTFKQRSCWRCSHGCFFYTCIYNWCNIYALFMFFMKIAKSTIQIAWCADYS